MFIRPADMFPSWLKANCHPLSLGELAKPTTEQQKHHIKNTQNVKAQHCNNIEGLRIFEI